MAERGIIVQKYGGTSLATPEHLRRVAGAVAAVHRRGHPVVVVVSAMGATTDQLMARVREVSGDPGRRELDLLLATGELASAALLAMAVDARGVAAVALSGPRCGIRTNGVHGNARILAVEAERIHRELDRGRVVVVAGFQGESGEGELTTLGRGGSDTTAVALAAALGAESCEIYTDVAGVFTADPRSVTGARPLGELDHREMQALAWNGAKVLKAEAVEFARENGVALEVRSSRGGGPGTRVGSGPRRGEGAGRPVWEPRRSAVSGVAGRKDLVRLRGGDGSSERVAELIAEVGRYDLFFGRLPSLRGPWALYLDTQEIPDLETFARDLVLRFGPGLEVTAGLGAVSLVGFGIGSRPRALLDAARVLGRAGLAPEDSWTGQESLTFALAEGDVDRGLEALHRAFVAEAAAAAGPHRDALSPPLRGEPIYG